MPRARIGIYPSRSSRGMRQRQRNQGQAPPRRRGGVRQFNVVDVWGNGPSSPQLRRPVAACNAASRVCREKAALLRGAHMSKPAGHDGSWTKARVVTRVVGSGPTEDMSSFRACSIMFDRPSVDPVSFAALHLGPTVKPFPFKDRLLFFDSMNDSNHQRRMKWRA
jgi:hypothetical protein